MHTLPGSLALLLFCALCTLCVSSWRINTIRYSEVQEYVTVTDVSEILCGSDSSDSTDDNGLVFLPKHARCASHTLNLVATHDMKQIITNTAGVEKSLWQSSMAKCTALWNNVARSTKSADTVESIIHVFAHTCSYSMERYYDAVKRVGFPCA